MESNNNYKNEDIEEKIKNMTEGSGKSAPLRENFKIFSQMDKSDMENQKIINQLLTDKQLTKAL
jgi:hypothetical protein